MAETANTIWRDNATDGVPSSGVHKPRKSEIRAWGTEMETRIQAGLKTDLELVRLLIDTNTAPAALTAGASIQSLTLAAGDRVGRAYNGATGDINNGVWVVQASGAALRSADMDSSDEILRSRFSVAAGTHAGETWAVQNTTEITVGATPIVIARTQAADATDAEVIAGRGGYANLDTRFDTIVDESFVQHGDVAAAANLATITKPGLYWLPTSGGYTNVPSAGQGFVAAENHYLLVMQAGDSTGHGTDRWILQTLIAFDVTTSLADVYRKVWTRSVDTTNPTTTTGNLAWVRQGQVVADLLSPYYEFRGSLASPDLNTVVATGSYIITGTPTNGYPGIGVSLLDVRSRGGDWITQRLIPLNHPSAEIVRRIRPPTDYGAWRPVKQGRAMHRNFAVLGDSVYQNGSVFSVNFTDQSVATLMSYLLAPTTTPVLMAMGGTRFADHTGIWAWSSGWKIGEAIGANDFAALIAGAAAHYTASIGSGDYDYRPQAANIAAWNWANTQRIVAPWGRNDKNGNIPLGFDGDTTGATYKGAMNKFVADIMGRYPLMVIHFGTPLFSFNHGVLVEAPNALGYEQWDYVQAMIDTALRLKQPCTDAYHGLGANALNFEAYFQDTSHPRYPYNPAPNDPSITGVLAEIIAADANRSPTPQLRWRSKSVDLTADNQVVGIGYANRVTINSDNATPANRTFLLRPPMNDCHRVTLVWGDSEAGELINGSAITGGGNVRLSADWTPGLRDTLTLQGHGQDWVETGRVNN